MTKGKHGRIFTFHWVLLLCALQSLMYSQYLLSVEKWDLCSSFIFLHGQAVYLIGYHANYRSKARQKSTLVQGLLLNRIIIFFF